MTVTYLMPTGEPATTTAYELKAALEGPVTIGLLSNGFPDTENFLARQAAALGELLPQARFRIATKAADQHLSAAITEPLLSDMAADCDAVVVAWGHCGSCTAGVTRDAIAFAARGVPTATLICDVFWDYSAWMARAFGMPAIPRVKLPYPTAGTGEACQREIAHVAAPEILRSLRDGATQRGNPT